MIMRVVMVVVILVIIMIVACVVVVIFVFIVVMACVVVVIFVFIVVMARVIVMILVVIVIVARVIVMILVVIMVMARVIVMILVVIVIVARVVVMILVVIVIVARVVVMIFFGSHARGFGLFGQFAQCRSPTERQGFDPLRSGQLQHRRPIGKVFNAAAQRWCQLWPDPDNQTRRLQRPRLRRAQRKPMRRGARRQQQRGVIVVPGHHFDQPMHRTNIRHNRGAFGQCGAAGQNSGKRNSQTCGACLAQSLPAHEISRLDML
jgi:hypothetical protein